MKALFRDVLPPRGGRRFTLVHEPGEAPRGLVVGLPPFAEELNKSRRTIAIASRALAEAGNLVVYVDPEGCGDSSGDLASASWSGWVDDTLEAIAWARRLSGSVPIFLWGTRAGCLLASEAQRRLGDGHLLLWQPQASGKLVLQQFLRLKMAGQLQQGGGRGMTEALNQQLALGHTVEVAGYLLGPRLARSLVAAQLQTPQVDSGAQVIWLEVSTQTPAELLPASRSIVKRWQAAGCTVRATAISGPQFWQSRGIEEALVLTDRTVVEVAEVTSSCIPALA